MENSGICNGLFAGGPRPESTKLQSLFARMGNADRGTHFVIALIHRNGLRSVATHPIEYLLAPFHEGCGVCYPSLALECPWIEAQIRGGQFIDATKLAAIISDKSGSFGIDEFAFHLCAANDRMDAWDDAAILDERNLCSSFGHFVANLEMKYVIAEPDIDGH